MPCTPRTRSSGFGPCSSLYAGAPRHGAQARGKRQSAARRTIKPYHIYFEGNAGLLTRDYAKFPNKVLWKLAEKVREVVSVGKVVRIEDSLGTNLTATYDGKRLYGMQFRAGDPPGRCHFPWGRCGVFNGDGQSNGEVYLSCVQAESVRPARHCRSDALRVDQQNAVGGPRHAAQASQVPPHGRLGFQCAALHR